MTGPGLHLADLSLRAGRFELRHVDLEIPRGAYAVLKGISGGGKTTLLEAICGLRHVPGGRVRINGRDVTRLRPADRAIGYVPQDGALFPKMRVRRQLALPLEVRGRLADEVRRRVQEAADLLEIGPLLDRSPGGLSGGERQRVALARAIAFPPDLLLLDEPLSALDESARDRMYDALQSVHRHTGVTALHVTHSAVEAERLADIVFMLAGGVVERVADPAASRNPSTDGPSC